MSQSSLAEHLRSKSAWNGECLEWTGARVHGYGYVAKRFGHLRAHRAAWSLANGPIPDGMFICHHCDNPSCIRLEHLYLGTPQTNMDDRSRRGRAQHSEPRFGARGDKHYSRRHPEKVLRGELNGLAKVNAEQVREMRALAASGVPQLTLVKRFGLSKATVCRIVNRKTYADVA